MKSYLNPKSIFSMVYSKVGLLSESPKGYPRSFSEPPYSRPYPCTLHPKGVMAGLDFQG